MARYYEAKASIRCWKQHTCVACGAIYLYLFQRERRVQAWTPQQAEKILQTRLERAMKREVDSHPCPSCGVLQPEMIGQRRARGHARVMWMAFAWIAAAVLLSGSGLVGMHMLGMVSMGVGFATLTVNIAVATSNPNSNLEKNRRTAQRRIESAEMVLGHAGARQTAERVPGSEAFCGTGLAALTLLGTGFLFLGASEGSRRIGRWPLNEELTPPVVGAGDTFRVRFPQEVRSVKGCWRGSATARCENAEDLRIATQCWEARSRTDDWPSSISVESTEPSSASRVYADVTVPDVEALTGKHARIAVHVEVTYPSMSGKSSFEELSVSCDHHATIHLAPRRAGALYTTLWWGGILVGGFLCGFGGLLLRDLARDMRGDVPPCCHPIASDVPRPQADLNREDPGSV